MNPRTPLLLLLAALCACTAPAAGPGTPVASATEGPVEARSLLGEPLRRPVLAPETRARLERDLAEARAAYERDPDDADAIIWLGRRLAYPGRYRDAIEVFSEGVRKHPDDARMYRHRGHRWITVRELDRAVADLAHAAGLIRGTADEVEPDGAPNRYGIPTSTLHTNIWYHLGLAYYLQGRFEEALEAYRRCMEAATNDDMRVATADWLYMTLRRLGRDAEAAAVLGPIRRDMRILENHAYHRRLLMYRGELPADSLLDASGADALQMATQGYGVGNWYLYNGEPERAHEVFRRVLGYGNWPAFGHIAAEAELSRAGR
jgi:tetratricopeptide (TPR) repeat protein